MENKRQKEKPRPRCGAGNPKDNAMRWRCRTVGPRLMTATKLKSKKPITAGDPKPFRLPRGPKGPRPPSHHSSPSHRQTVAHFRRPQPTALGRVFVLSPSLDDGAGSLSPRDVAPPKRLQANPKKLERRDDENAEKRFGVEEISSFPICCWYSSRGRICRK